MSDLNVVVTPFSPPPKNTVSIPATAASASVQLSFPTVQYTRLTQTNNQFLVYNAGFADAFLEFGNATVVATVPNGATPGSLPIPAGAYVVVTPVGQLNSYAAAICLAGQTTTLYISSGDGS